MTKIIVFILCALFLLPLHAQEHIQGLIPRFYAIEAASDLSVAPDVAHQMALKGFDLSTLDPDTNTNIWNPTNKFIPELSLAAKDETLTYIKSLPSRSGQLRFTVQNDQGRELIVILSKKVHNLLLRRNLLAKLGYNTQPMSWVPRFKLNFTDSVDRDLFKEDMKDKLLADMTRWVTTEADLTLVMQDALVLTPESEIYNLATGIMATEIHQSRRLLRAPYIPLALVDATESVNLMPWQAGRVILNNLKLNHTQELDNGFGTSWEDARWIGRRLSKLTRADFEEIVGKAYFPFPVEKLLIEKIVARRNDLMELLMLDLEGQKLSFNPQVSLPPSLVDGEIVQEFFEGYAGRYSYGDPESPFSASELGSFALTQGQGELIQAGIGRLNKLFGTDEESKYLDKLTAIVNKEGPFFTTQAIAVPTFHANIILSRDIVTGTYLGTNNKVQLVDNFGYSMDAGVFGGIEGLPHSVSLKAGASLAFQRMFSHVKPIQTLKKSLKEPYKNMYVPMLIKGIGHKIDKLSKVSGTEAEKLIQSVLGELKGTLGVGESFIITDSLVPSLFTSGELSLSQFVSFDPKLLKVSASVQAQRMILTRFHILRSDDETFQIYQDYGKSMKLMLTLKLRSHIPILAFKANWTRASAETHFYPISLRPQDVTVESLKALRQSIFSLNHQALQEIVKPHRVENSIKGDSNTFQFLIFKRNKFGSSQTLALSHARGGEKKKIYRRYDAVTNGVDTESYARETINDLIKLILKSDTGLSEVVTMNPGFTLYGKAKNKIFTSEAEGKRVTVSYQRILNGWRIPGTKIKGKLEQINAEAGRKIFDPLVMMTTNSILLYQISFLYTLAQEGNEQILKSDLKRIQAVMNKYVSQEVPPENVMKASRRYFNSLKKIKTLIAQENPTQGMEELHEWLKAFQDEVTVKGLEELAGKENIAYQGRIEGFRQGDENGDTPVFSHVYGELPLPLHTTPTQKVIQNWGIIEGELTGSWMMERAI